MAIGERAASKVAVYAEVVADVPIHCLACTSSYIRPIGTCVRPPIFHPAYNIPYVLPLHDPKILGHVAIVGQTLE